MRAAHWHQIDAHQPERLAPTRGLAPLVLLAAALGCTKILPPRRVDRRCGFDAHQPFDDRANRGVGDRPVDEFMPPTEPDIGERGMGAVEHPQLCGLIGHGVGDQLGYTLFMGFALSSAAMGFASLAFRDGDPEALAELAHSDAVPPVERILIPRAWSLRANSTMPVLSETLINARVTG